MWHWNAISTIFYNEVIFCSYISLLAKSYQVHNTGKWFFDTTLQYEGDFYNCKIVDCGCLVCDTSISKECVSPSVRAFHSDIEGDMFLQNVGSRRSTCFLPRRPQSVTTVLFCTFWSTI